MLLEGIPHTIFKYQSSITIKAFNLDVLKLDNEYDGGPCSSFGATYVTILLVICKSGKTRQVSNIVFDDIKTIQDRRVNRNICFRYISAAKVSL